MDRRIGAGVCFTSVLGWASGWCQWGVAIAKGGFARVMEYCKSWQVTLNGTSLSSRNVEQEMLAYREQLTKSENISPAELIGKAWEKNPSEMYSECYGNINALMSEQESLDRPRAYYTVIAWSLLCLTNNDFKEITNFKEFLKKRITLDNAVSSSIDPMFAKRIPVALEKLFENDFATLSEDLTLMAQKILRDIIECKEFIWYFIDNVRTDLPISKVVSQRDSFDKFMRYQSLEVLMFITLFRALLKIEDKINNAMDESGILSVYESEPQAHSSHYYGKLKQKELVRLHSFFLDLMIDDESFERIDRIDKRIRKKWGLAVY